MAEAYRTSLFLFRRDLRLDDNTGLREALELSGRVIPAFVFDPRQQPQANDYFSRPAFQFMVESLEDLARQLEDHGGRLYRFEGEPHEIVGRLAGEAGVESVFVNRDYTPFSRRRDGRLQELCAREGLHFQQASDLLLHEPGTIKTGSGDVYKVFTPFYRKAREMEVAEPSALRSAEFFTGDLAGACEDDPGRRILEEAGGELERLHVHGGRGRALEILDDLGRFAEYEEMRDAPAQDGTTSLSAHHKFGTVSVREVRRAILDTLGSEGEPLLRQLYWRDFFTHLAFFEPRVFGEAFQEQYDGVEWDGVDGSPGRERFEAWCEGRTGFPLVDAGMRQLVESGWMHNRVRMIVASFLTKDLHLDWRLGERFFARHLVDYDPAVNNGNWQWAASTGADAQPYFRIFNPWSQQERHDPEGEYVRRWVPELEGVEPRDLHRLHRERPPGIGDYPEPIVDHAEEREEALGRFQTVRNRARNEGPD